MIHSYLRQQFKFLSLKMEITPTYHQEMGW